ncbi:hypothetical protein GCM10011519_10320 [Marmoricola endophyticus]|uniref:FAD-binding FR-type domain-containing protein n=1 Tax=Marmoricola endophyticus TaxID=2040280 RepID=A0A917BDT7_9ACTN|nr:siderophore-interacting protein [Marmoricola endophyticus]GGF38664.1 hypothetical protein GCM10011519_10320 [Marmoricola endophyticus]
MTQAPVQRGRRERPVTTFTVTGTSRTSPGLVRVELRADDAEAFAERFGASAYTDRYVKLALPQPDGTEVVRTYTVLEPDPATATMAIEFVVHGDEGYAGPWAARAEVGDSLGMRGPGGAYAPDVDADWHLLAGDEAGLPAIRAALAALPASATARVVLLAPEDHHVDLPTTDDTEVTWVTDDLPGAVRAVEWLPGRAYAFVHGEADAVMHGVRPYLLKERGLPRADVSVSGYWRRGRTEEGFRDWKAELRASEGDDG